VILPEYEPARLFVMDPGITGVVRHVTGPDPDLSNVRIIAK
jgi:hypothetical protein